MAEASRFRNCAIARYTCDVPRSSAVPLQALADGGAKKIARPTRYQQR